MTPVRDATGVGGADRAAPFSPPLLTAVVLNWRDPESTAACLASLRADSAVGRFVLVDNESTGELAGLAGGPVTLIEEPANLGFAGGVNLGIREALDHGADAVLIINNDAVLGPESATRLMGALQGAEANVGALAPLIINPDGSPQSTGGRFRPLDASTKDTAASDADYLTWACVLVPRATFDSVGLLDERFFMYWEDVDFGLRVRDAGLTLRVVTDAVVTHALSQSHGRAGARIDRYSAHGLILLCLKRGGLAAGTGMPYRVFRRLAKRWRNRERFAAVLSGVGDGVHAFRQPWRSTGSEEGTVQ